MRRPVEGGGVERDHLEALARRGRAEAIAALERPESPECMGYLADIFYRLDSMREYDMNGPRRFTPSHIKHAIDLFGWTLRPQEVEAICALDIATLYPDAGVE